MDEPLSNLDAKLRVQTRTQIASLQRRLGVTTVYVTHDQVEALTMGDRVAVLRDGVLQQLGTPRELYRHPANVFVAGFIGSPAMNLLRLPATDGGVHFGDMVYPVDRSLLSGAGDHVILGVRPEDLEIAEHGLRIEVDLVEETGADAYVYGSAVGTAGEASDIAPAPGQAVDTDGNAEIVVRVVDDHPPAKGDMISLVPKLGRVHLFDPDSELRFDNASAATPA